MTKIKATSLYFHVTLSTNKGLVGLIVSQPVITDKREQKQQVHPVNLRKCIAGLLDLLSFSL